MNESVGGKKSDQIDRLMSRDKGREWGEMNATQLKAQCSEQSLNCEGDLLALRLRLFYHHFGTTPAIHPAVLAAANTALPCPEPAGAVASACMPQVLHQMQQLLASQGN